MACDWLYKISFFAPRSDLWLWEIQSQNGCIIHASTKGFCTKQGAKENFLLLNKIFAAYLDEEADAKEKLSTMVMDYDIIQVNKNSLWKGTQL